MSRNTPKVDFVRFDFFCMLNNINVHTALAVWEQQKRFGSWDLGVYITSAPSRETIRKARKAVEAYLD